MTRKPTFPDVPPDHPQYIEIEMMSAAGMIRARPDGTFRTDEPLTRAEAAELAFKLLSHVNMLRR